ncbi:MAG: hypothetical protein ABI165_17110, partial [Bryobacteraceae bacterium]
SGEVAGGNYEGEENGTGMRMLEAVWGCCVFAAITGAGLMAAEPPHAEISNGVIQAKLYVPDAADGYYRATRFDWSGVIASLEYKGHEYFGQWFERYDPKLHDSIMGPVESFNTGDAGLGYKEAAAGGTFIRIGVGVVRKPSEPAYKQFNTYDIVDNGQWSTHRKPNDIAFQQKLAGPAGYAYVYRKTVRMVKGKPEMVLEHTLKNTGDKPIDTSVFDHNFFMIDHLPIGPDVTITFPFELKASGPLNGAGVLRGRQIGYTRELKKGESVHTELSGFGNSASDYDIRIENAKAGAGVRIRGDHPLEKVVFWSIRTTACPEPYIHLHVEPGSQVTWRITYDFYEIKTR